MKVARVLSAAAIALAIIGGVAVAGNGAGRFGYFAPDVTTLAAEFGNPGEHLQVVQRAGRVLSMPGRIGPI